ncbi:long-chain-fatty-acid--CoA ligase [Georgenia yuyongxinii]|uniref:Long-chain-fatty-acid--CoA ligase n=1 Tax=Georgenia yuyongxinii TaxID=2589797 RepID=A0A552WXU6_9MICO|nr:long-chain-fatty-acid--CoA ligase [Georgenia yuyongxinii]TRW47648.1 long-chain-fatty-acid--CoA ligase [Georgenia yuyongxinii]
MLDNLTLGQIVKRNADRFPHRTAFICGERRDTFAEYNRRVNRAAHALSSLGVEFGDHVATLGKNSIEYFEIYHGSAKIGAVFGTVNWRLAPTEISFIVTDGDSKVLMVEAELQDKVEPILDELAGIRLVVYGGSPRLPGALSYEELLAASSEEEPDVDVASADEAVIMYTSGTTGLPKGAVLTHGSVFWDAVSYLTYVRPAPPDSLLVGMPMNHIAGLHIQATAFLVRALPIVILPSWDAAEACRLIEKHRITTATILVAPLQQMLELPDLAHYDLSSLRVVLTAAAKYTRAWAARALNALELDRLLFAYGLTEASALISVTEYSGQMLDNENTIGFPVWYDDIRIVDADDRDVPQGEIGELIVRGPNLFKGYYKRPEANAEVFRNGWLHTGDMVSQDENGFLYFQDRVKDMVKTGGMNVYSIEVEMGLVKANPELAEVAVIGVPDERWGEAVVAVVVRAQGASITQDEILERSRQYLAGFKLPKRIMFHDELPKNISGKVQKTVLREIVAEELPHGVEQTEKVSVEA